MNQTNFSQSTILIASVFSGFTWSGYISSIVCLFGLVTNALSIWIFFSPKLKHVLYKLMLAKSIGSFAYLTISLITEFVSYCVYCDWSSTYFTALYTLVFNIFISSSLTIFRLFIDVTISLQLYCILANKNWLGKVSLSWILVILGVFAIVYYIQNPFTYEIIQVPGQNMFYLLSTKFGLSEANKILTIVQMFVRLFLGVIVVGLVNSVNIILFKRRYMNRVISSTVPIKVTSKCENFIQLF